MAYDPRLREVVLFGGDNSQGVALGDSWTWKAVTGWVELAPARAPDARFGASMVYDRRLRNLVVFGGETAGGVQNDTWSFDGSSWQPVTTPTSPPPRVQHAMTYDTRLHAVVVWGGVGSFGDLADTWFFNGSTGEVHPSPKQFGSAVDSGRDRWNRNDARCARAGSRLGGCHRGPPRVETRSRWDCSRRAPTGRSSRGMKPRRSTLNRRPSNSSAPTM